MMMLDGVQLKSLLDDQDTLMERDQMWSIFLHSLASEQQPYFIAVPVLGFHWSKTVINHIYDFLLLTFQPNHVYNSKEHLNPFHVFFDKNNLIQIYAFWMIFSQKLSRKKTKQADVFIKVNFMGIKSFQN